MQLKMFQDKIKFHPDQLKHVQENEANKFCFTLIWLVTCNHGQSHWKWHKMVEVKSVYDHGRYEKKILVEKFVCNVQH